MTELVNRFMYTPAWDGYHMVSFMIGLFSILALLLGFAATRRAKVLAWSGVGVLLLSVAVSMLFEEILPVWPTLAAARRLPFALSFGGFVAFLVIFVYAGRKLIQGGLFTYFPQLFKSSPHRSEAVRALRPGVLWFGVSAAVFVVSLLGYHGLDVILGRTN